MKIAKKSIVLMVSLVMVVVGLSLNVQFNTAHGADVSTLPVGHVRYDALAAASAPVVKCAPRDEVGGTLNGGSATAHNKTSNKNCTVSLAVYRVFGTTVATQELFDSQTFDVAPGHDIDLSVELPSCSYQIDLVTGGVKTPPNYGSSQDIIHYDMGNAGKSCSDVPTPTPSNTATPTPTPTYTVTPTPVNAPYVDLRCDNSNGPCWIPAGTSSNLSWTTNAYTTSCVASGAWSGSVSVNGSLSTGSLWTTQNYSINCYGPGGSAFDNVVVNVYGPTYTPTPTPTNNVSCSPFSQTINSGDYAYLTATGGTGYYFWSVPNGNPASGLYSNFSTRLYTNLSDETRLITVQSGGYSDVCRVRILGTGYVTPTPTPTPTYILAIQKLGKDVTKGQATEQTSLVVYNNDTLEFDLHVRNNTAVTLNNVIVTDHLPAGINYIAHTTSINGILAPDGIATTGLNVGTLNPNQEVVLKFNALVQALGHFPNGSITTYNQADVRADNAGLNSAQLQVRLASIGTISQVQTGVADSIALAVLFSAIVTFAYMGYTTTGLFSRRDAQAALTRHSNDKDRLNFARFL